MTLDRERQLESKMVDLGRARAKRLVNDAKVNERETSLRGGNELLKRVVFPLSEAIEKWKEEMSVGRRRPPIALAYLKLIDSDLASYITARTVIDSLSRSAELRTVVLRIAAKVEDEVRFGSLREGEPKLWAHLQRCFAKNNSADYRYRHRVMADVQSRYQPEIDWKPWAVEDKVHLGAVLMDLLIQSTGIVQIVAEQTAAKRQVNRVMATPETMAWVTKENGRLLTPVYMPTIVPPKPWESPAAGSGGYLYIKRPLVKIHKRAYQEELANTEMPTVLRAVNALQETAWKVNEDVLGVAQALWNADVNVDDKLLPNKVQLELPPKLSEAEAMVEDLLKERKRERAKIHTYNKLRQSRVFAASSTLRLADEMNEYDAFFFPHQLDFRSRAYTMPSGLTPQGSDLERGLLLFADGEPLGASGVEWLAIHGANCWGEDKVALEDRVKWVDAHWTDIEKSASDPLGHRQWWAQADKPWQFLAFCFEWKAMASCPDGLEAFVSHLPVSMDGSCNGLQHFAAMLRDHVGGAAVNLVPMAKPQDVYLRVLEKVKQTLVSCLLGDEEGDDYKMARAWCDALEKLEPSKQRKLVKRPVMTLPYGSTRNGIVDQMMEDVIRNAVQEGTLSFPNDPSGFIHTNWLGGLVWEAMGQVVVAARAAMDWLQKLAGLLAQSNQPVVWRTPAGFPVRHARLKMKEKRIETAIGGARVRISLQTELDGVKLDAQKQRSGVSPHFVHSLDATHLYWTICAALDEGITSFAAVHDSYGTHAAKAALLARILREQFVKLYTEHDPLQEIEDSVAAVVSREKLPPQPPRGSLDLNAVKDAAFFFA
jgi:DNA-directed RNA polymerase